MEHENSGTTTHLHNFRNRNLLDVFFSFANRFGPNFCWQVVFPTRTLTHSNLAQPNNRPKKKTTSNQLSSAALQPNPQKATSNQQLCAWRFYNIQALCLIRLVEMAVISPSSTGAGIKAFIDVFDEDGALISTIFALGLVVWHLSWRKIKWPKGGGKKKLRFLVGHFSIWTLFRK